MNIHLSHRKLYTWPMTQIMWVGSEIFFQISLSQKQTDDIPTSGLFYFGKNQPAKQSSLKLFILISNIYGYIKYAYLKKSSNYCTIPPIFQYYKLSQVRQSALVLLGFSIKHLTNPAYSSYGCETALL